MRNARYRIVRWPSGFTLVEVMIAIALTSLLIGSMASLLLVGLSVQRQSLEIQGLLSQGSIVAEYMTRALKQAKKDTAWTCLSGSGSDYLNYQLTHFDNGVKFINARGECQEFYWEGDPVYRIKETINGIERVFLSTDDIKILAFKPFLRGQFQADLPFSIQPRVTLYFDIQGKGAKPGIPQQRFQIQTTVSQRAYDILQ